MTTSAPDSAQAPVVAQASVAVVFFTAQGKQIDPLYFPWVRIDTNARGLPSLVAGTGDPKSPSRVVAFLSGIDGWQIADGWQQAGHRFPSFTIVSSAVTSGGPQ